MRSPIPSVAVVPNDQDACAIGRRTDIAVNEGMTVDPPTVPPLIVMAATWLLCMVMRLPRIRVL